jgi:hypothetical protein
MNRRIARVCFVLGSVAAVGCAGAPRTDLARLQNARQLSAESLLQFAKVAEAGNRVVMADNPDAAAIAGKDLNVATEAVTRNTAVLADDLKELSYSREAALLEEFQKQFADFRALDREITALAELDTNLKAQRLSFGAAQEAADALRDSFANVVQKSPSDDWRIRALASEVLSSVREVQALQAPHIAESDDAIMNRLEERVGRARSSAQKTLAGLANVARAQSKAAVQDAASAFDRFFTVHDEIIKLSRRNSNVRALALALGRRRTLAAVCEEHLRAVQEELAKRDIGPRR